MKKTYFLATIMAASLLTACTGSETNIEESDGALSVTASIGETSTGVTTRALTTAFSGSTIGVFVYPTTSTDGSSICSVTTGGSSSFTPSDPSIYINAAATVYAYYPATEIATANLTSTATIPATVLSTDYFEYEGATVHGSQTDYLWATPQSVDKANRTATLPFYHALSKIIFKVVKDAHYAGTGTLTSIVLTDADATTDHHLLAGTGTMQVADGVLAGSLAAPAGDSLTFTHGTGVAVNAYGSSAETAWFLVAPLSATYFPTSISLTMIIDGKYYTLGSEVYLPTTVTSWDKGTSYTYTITVGSEELSVSSSVSINDWTASSTIATSVVK
jgi:hypothetical protein